jgi:1,2-diacylglycerol 3-alpha-glucosyltransferase
MAKHLVILTPGFSASESDTESLVFMQTFIKSLNILHADIRVTVITFQFPFTSKEYSWFGNRVIPLNGRNSKAKKPIIWLKALNTLKKLNRETPISGMLCLWLMDCSLIGKHFATKHNIPFLCWAIGQDVKPDNHYLKLLRLKETELAVMSKNQAELLKQSNIICSKVIENGILPEDFTAYKKADDSFSIHVLGVGSLTELKNYIEFIETIELVVKQVPDIRCEILGDGPQREILQQTIIEKNLQNNIVLMGAVPHHKVIETMYQSLILLHPSTYEGNSTVMLEAAYTGNYVLCKLHIARHQSGLLKTYTDTKSAAEIIVNIIKNPTEGSVSKPKEEMLSSMHDRAEEILKHLGID